MWICVFVVSLTESSYSSPYILSHRWAKVLGLTIQEYVTVYIVYDFLLE